MISAFEVREYFLSIIEQIITAQLYLVLGVALCTMVLLSFRRFYSRRFQTHQSFFLDLVVQEITELDPENKTETKITRPSKFSFIKHEALKSLLLSQIDTVSGPERRYLIDVYVKLGFARMDLDNCFSTFWWKRIEGISRLSHLDISGISITLNRLRLDSHPLVAESALLALSRLEHKFNNPTILEKLPKKTLQKHNILLKIASNWISVHGAQFVVDYLKTEKRSEVLKAFIAILSDQKDTAVAKSLVTWFMEHGNLEDTKLLLQILKNLKAVADPLYLPIARDLLVHEDPIIRAEALDMILTMGSEDYKAEIEKMNSDKALPVQRLLHRYHKTRVA